MGCCGNQEEEPVVGEDLELGLDGSAVDEIETYEQSVEKMLGVSSGVQIALGVMAVIQVIILFVLACVVWFVYKHYFTNSVPRRRPQYMESTDYMDDDERPEYEDIRERDDYNPPV
eukprot:91796_1